MSDNSQDLNNNNSQDNSSYNKFDFNQRPEDVKELEKALGDFTAYRSTVISGNFSGTHAKVVVQLVEFLTATYKQLLSQYENHEWVKAARAAYEEIKKQEEAKAQEQKDLEGSGQVNA